MTISIGADLAGARVLAATLSSPSEREEDRAMAAQDAATETQSEGLKRRHTVLDRLREEPSALDRFAD